jgi:hypothetical protein
MNHKTYLWINLCLLAALLAACSLVRSKADVIKCTGTNHATSTTAGESKWMNGVNHETGIVFNYDQESNCPELTGVWTVYVNLTGSDASIWGTFYFETAYNGGGVLEGTFHGTNDHSNPANGFWVEATSYNGTGSLSGLQYNGSFQGPLDSPDLTFDATLQNPTSE